MYGNNYLMFESEVERLKPLFLMEAEDDDLEESTPKDDKPADDDDKKSDDKKKSEDESSENKGDSKPEDTDEESNETSGESSGDGFEELDDANGETGGETEDFDLDRDMPDITGGLGEPQNGGDVNANNGTPGAITPERLIAEITSGQDNIYTRVINEVKPKFPNGECQVKDLLEPIAHAISAYLKNKKYPYLGKEESEQGDEPRKCNSPDKPCHREKHQGRQINQLCRAATTAGTISAKDRIGPDGLPFRPSNRGADPYGRLEGYLACRRHRRKQRNGRNGTVCPRGYIAGDPEVPSNAAASERPAAETAGSPEEIRGDQRRYGGTVHK